MADIWSEKLSSPMFLSLPMEEEDLAPSPQALWHRERGVALLGGGAYSSRGGGARQTRRI